MTSFKLPEYYYEDDDDITSTGYSGTCTGLNFFDRIPNNYNYNSDQCDEGYKYLDDEDINEDYSENYAFARYARHTNDSDDPDEYNRSNNTSQCCTPEDIDDDCIYGYNDIPDTFLQHNTQNADLKMSIDESIQNNVDQYKIWLKEESVFNGGRDDTNKLDQLLLDNSNTREKTLVLCGSYISELPDILLGFDWIEELIIKYTNINKIEYLPPNLQSLIVENNQIEILDGTVIPSSVKNLKFTSNKTRTIIGLKNGLKDVNLGYNLLSNIDSVIPLSVSELKLNNNGLLKLLPTFEDDGYNLKALDISGTRISDIDDVPYTVQFLSTCETEIREVNKLPLDLLEWKSYKCSKLRKINCEFPNGVIEIDLCGCALSTCPDIPNNVRLLDLSYNVLQSIPKIPPTIEKVSLQNNEHLSSEAIEDFKMQMPLSVQILVTNTNDQINILDEFNESNESNESNDPTESILHYNQLKCFRNGSNTDTNTFEQFRASYLQMRKEKEFVLDYSNQFKDENPHYIILKKKYTF